MLDMKQCKKLSSYLHKNLIYKKKDTDFSFFSCAIGEWKITRVEWLHLLSTEQLMIDIQVVEARQQASSKDDRYLEFHKDIDQVIRVFLTNKENF